MMAQLEMSKSLREAMQSIAPFMNIGLQMALPIIGGVFLGNYIDGKNETGFLWTLILTGVGFAVSIFTLTKAVQTLNKQNQKNKKP